MDAQIAAQQARQELQVLEKEAATLAAQHEPESSQDDVQRVTQDRVRSRAAYLKMLHETISAMTASVRANSRVTEANSGQLLQALQQLQDMEQQEEQQLLLSKEAQQLLESKKNVSCDDIVYRINEMLTAIREMLFDLKTMDLSGGRGDEDEQATLDRLPCLQQHACPSWFESSNGVTAAATETGTKKGGVTWAQLQDQRQQLTALLTKYRSERNDMTVNARRKIKKAQDALIRIHPRHPDKESGV